MNIPQAVLSPIVVIGDFSLFGADTIRAWMKLWKRRGLFLKHCEFIGVTSIAITCVAAIFLGGVLGYQLFVSLHMFGAEALLGGSVGVGLYRELAPVMASIMVTGRAAAAMAAELSSMRISEQIDALEVMGVDPIEYLVTPRVAAGFCMMPILGILFAAVGSLAASVVACGLMGLSHATYWTQYMKVVDAIDLIHCGVKSAVFGLILSWVGCFCGYSAQGGAQAVGVATRNTVVTSCLAILLSDYLLTCLLPFGFSRLSM